MALRSTLTRLAIATATGALAATAAVTPAAADDDRGDSASSPSSSSSNRPGNGNWQNISPSGRPGNGDGDGDGQEASPSGRPSNGDGNGQEASPSGRPSNGDGDGDGDGQDTSSSGRPGNGEGEGDWGGHGDDQRLYRGVVTADTLLLRSAPNRGSQVIRAVHRGDVVSIFCKTPGESVQGNPLWYLLTDGTWAWGAARYIDNIGPAPRWC